MKLLALLACTVLCGTAAAADLKPVFLKAPPASVGCTISSCIGLFVGGSIAQAGGSIDVLGTGLNGIAQNGFRMGGQVGYEFFANKFYFAGLVHLEDNFSLHTVPGTSFTDRLDWGVCARLGYQLSGILGTTTAGVGTTPTLPQELASSLMTPYVNVCEDKVHGQPAIVTGLGLEALLAANALGRSAWTLNLDYMHYNFNQGGTAGSMTTVPAILPITQTSADSIKASVNYHFGI